MEIKIFLKHWPTFVVVCVCVVVVFLGGRVPPGTHKSLIYKVLQIRMKLFSKKQQLFFAK